MSEAPAPAVVSPGVSRFFLALGALGLAGTVVCAVGWYLAARGPRSLDDLGPEERLALVQALVKESPGTFVPAWYDPPIGYTLRPGQETSAWNDRFTANELGYRTGPAAKPPRTFRIVFLGDSWTFGMGIRREEAFPHGVQEIAKARSGMRRRIEAWDLGMPGYNTFNELAAFQFLDERLKPDAVVICPTMNDVDSAGDVLPNGSLARAGVGLDGFGSDHSLVYRNQLLDSYQFRGRWLAAFRAIRAEEERLRRRGVPVLVYFTATWQESFAHWLVAESGLAAPYVITPVEFTGSAWRNPPPFRHGTPAANRLYARMVYQGLARLLRWPPLAPSEQGADVRVYDPSEARRLAGPAEELLRTASAENIAEEYRPAPDRAAQCAGPMDCGTGLMGRATTVLIRRRPGAERLLVSVRPLPEAASLYPLSLRVTVPSPAGGSPVEFRVEPGPEVQSFAVPIPRDLGDRTVLDVALRVERVVAAPDVLAARSLIVSGIEQE